MAQQPAKPILRQDVRPGDRILADEQQTINRTVSAIVGGNDQRPNAGKLKVVKLSAARVGEDDSTDTADQGGTIQAYDPANGDWGDTQQETANIADPNGAVWDEGFRAFCIYDSQSGKRIPINPIWSRPARTVADTDENGDPSYPASNTAPNVYPIKFTAVDFVQEAGRQSPTVTFLNAGDEPDGYVLNLNEGQGYLAEGSDVLVHGVSIDGVPRWYIHTCCETDEQSSSSGSSELSSASSFSRSESSVSQDVQSDSSLSPGPDQDCPACGGSASAPTQLKVVLAGLVDNISCINNACLNLNGTYIVPFYSSTVSHCFWFLELGYQSDCANYFGLRVDMSFDTGINTHIAITLVRSVTTPITPDTGGSEDVLFFYEGGLEEVFDCHSFADLDVPFDSTGSNSGCEGAGATCTLTSL